MVPSTSLRRLLSLEALGGLLLIVVAALALIIANSRGAPLYFEILEIKILGLSILHWINDALMAGFFLLVGLEIKRELLDGELSTWPRRVLPGIAAVGGMVVPALIYIELNAATPETLRGWAIPTATDIAFALGILSLLGSRVPLSLKVFLTALAILDDLGAVAVIAVAYTSELSLPMLAVSALVLLGLAALNWRHIEVLWPYLALGGLLWFFVHKSGVHATLAGVALALMIPLKPANRTDESKSALIRLEHALHPWVAFLIVPIFGFANAGVPLSGLSPNSLLAPVPLGIALGLFVGKQLGVVVFSWLAIRAKLAELPVHANWLQFYGVAALCGIGFTMSLFIGLLAFPASPEVQAAVKVGVLAGSIVSALTGVLCFLFAARTTAVHKS